MKRHYSKKQIFTLHPLKIGLFMLLLNVSLTVSAQEEVQNKAVATCSNPWQWNQINDMLKGPSCGGQTAFVWTSGPPDPLNDWMMWEWSEEMSLDSLYIWHAQTTGRFLTGGTIQGWDGSAWYDFYTFSNLSQSNCENGVKFPSPLITKKMRIYKLKTGTGQNSNPNFREIEIWTFPGSMEFTLSGDFNGGNYFICEGEKVPLKVKLSASSNKSFKFPNPRLGFQLNNGKIFYKSIPEIEPNETEDFAFSDLVDLTNAPKQSILKVFVSNSYLDSSQLDDTLTFLLTVTRGSSGANFIPEVSTFRGTPKLGYEYEPDIITTGQSYRYTITPPTGLLNTSYGITWTSSFKATIDGEVFPASNLIYQPPQGSQDAYVIIKINNHDNEVDKVVKLEYVVKDLVGNQCDTTTMRYAIVYSSPQVSFESEIACSSDEIQFFNNSYIVHGEVDYSWDFGDGTTSDQFYPSHQFLNSGQYTVVLIGTSNNGFADTFSKVITLLHSPTPDFTFTNSCGSIPFQLSGTADVPVSYSWNFGNGDTASGQNMMYAYQQPGLYDITLTVMTPDGCESAITKSAYSYPAPIADFELPINICAGQSLNIVNTTSIPFSNWGSEWHIGNQGVRSFDKNPDIIFVEFGTQTVRLKVTSQFGCVDSISKSINVQAAPIINITSNDVCSKGPVIFNSNINVPNNVVASYIWKIDGVLYADAQPTVDFGSVSGTKAVNVDIKYDNGCMNHAATQIITGYRPNVDFSIADVNCANTPISLSNNTTIEYGNAHYQWIMGDGMEYNEQITPNHTYTNNTPTDYTITLIATSEGGACPDSISKNIRVGIIPVCDFSIHSNWDKGQGWFSLTPTSITEGEYKWYFGDGSVSTEQYPTHQYAQDGNYAIKLIVTTPEGCNCTKTMQYYANSLGLSQINADADVVSYPNPSTGVVYIENLSNSPILNIVVTNTLGATVYNNAVSTLNKNLTLDLSYMANGMYLITMSTENGNTYTHKVMIAK